MAVQRFEHNGRTIVYERLGAGAPVVLLHNLGTSRLVWTHQMRALARHREVFALDLLGYGDSDRGARDEYTLANYTDLLARLIDEQGLERVALVGNCVGAATALSYAIRRPATVTALVLANPATYATVGPRPLGAAIRLANALPWVARRLAVLRTLSLPAPIAAAILDQQLGPGGSRARLSAGSPAAELRALWTRPGALQPLVDSDIAADFRKSFAALDRALLDPDFPPICTIWGARNRVLSSAAGHRLDATVLRPRRAETFTASGHLPMLEEPDRFTDVVERFLLEVGGPAARGSESEPAQR
ncbi:alpha/beta fold hydrolase [Nocardia stercoris]|uniref:Alpha/beta fold hydrolase n=1 Tax=Nocardia stercoris TaxID=2483361 RepID=A0A3M2KVV3_9NOCA|nr:alpha/beta hydrolase [Nocardia stercoris]RMI28343.1 alpha/beta fold hydrolase [Nocardia stercoris]